MLSKFLVLSLRGDAIISKDYRGDSPRDEADLFFRRVKFWSNREKGKAPPVFRINDVTYVWVERNGLMFACNTRFNVSPSTIIELLHRVVKVVKDYCGVLSEEAIRKNFVLIYELLDELIDFGYPQDTSTESLKAFVHNEPVLVDAQKIRVPSLSSKTTPSSSVHKPISAGKVRRSARSNRNEIFVDILERLTMLFSSSGAVINSTVDGCIQMKSYLSGNPELRLALNEDLVVGKGGPGEGVTLDDCNFHECVRLDDFETSRLLTFIPPEGEFVALNYRCTGEFRAPFQVMPQIEEISPFQLEIAILVRADLPETNYGSNVIMTVPCPRNTAGTASALLSAVGVVHSVDYDAQNRRLLFSIKKFQGGSEHTFRSKLTLSSICTAQTLKEIGPVSLTFEIPMYNVTTLQVKYLHIAEHSKAYNPHRWVRYITRSSSYVCRCG